MPGTFSGIEIARRALQAHQISLETTGHNIANANTPGYSRQQAVHSASDPYTLPVPLNELTVGQLGTGVEVSLIRRIRNEYLDTQVRNSTSAHSYWSTQEQVYARIESVFPEPGSQGIGDAMTRFFRAWHDLNNTPQDPGVKAAVAELGDELANLMRESYTQLENINESIVRLKVKDDGSGDFKIDGGQLQDQVNTVNDMLKQVRNLTEGIKQVYAHGNQPNDLLDKRDMLLDQLAEYVPLEVIQKNDAGDIELEIFGEEVDFKKKNADYPVVTVQYNDQGDADSENDVIELTIKSITGSATVSLNDYAVNAPPRSSILALEMSRSKVEGYQDKLVVLSDALKKIIDDQTPFDSTLLTNDEFFSGTLGGANDFGVNTEVMADPTIIDGEKAIDVARLYNIGMDGSTVPSVDLQGTTLAEYFNAVLSDIGTNSSTATDMTENQYAVNQQILSVRDSAQGVNLDEELSMLIQFQHGYQASARVMTTLDELLDHLINRTA